MQRWADAIAKRPAVQRGRMVNRVFGEPSSQLHERHDAGDFDTKTQDKIGEPAKSVIRSLPFRAEEQGGKNRDKPATYAWYRRNRGGLGERADRGQRISSSVIRAA